jgi:hypothetical protein
MLEDNKSHMQQKRLEPTRLRSKHFPRRILELDQPLTDLVSSRSKQPRFAIPKTPAAIAAAIAMFQFFALELELEPHSVTPGSRVGLYPENCV